LDDGDDGDGSCVVVGSLVFKEQSGNTTLLHYHLLKVGSFVTRFVRVFCIVGSLVAWSRDLALNHMRPQPGVQSCTSCRSGARGCNLLITCCNHCCNDVQLQPGVHYLPFWRSEPDDVLRALQWAKVRWHD
jgi:hypothetical protein